MASTRPFALVRTKDQWLRAAYSNTALDDEGGIVELAWAPESDASSATPPTSPSAGLAFDSWCRLYHSVPLAGHVDRIAWAARDPFSPPADEPESIDLIDDAPPGVLGDFTPTSHAPGLLDTPRGLAVDEHDRLFVAAWGSATILVYDLVNRRLLRTIALAHEGANGPRPVDLAAHGSTVYALTEGPTELLALTAYGPPSKIALPVGLTTAVRVAVSSAGRIAVLDASANKVWLLDAGSPRAVDVSARATDIEFESEDVLVVAHYPGEDFVRVPLGDVPLARPGLKARGYDGLGIIRTPDGRIGFFTALGFRNAVQVRLRYTKQGTVTTFQLDSGEWQTTWGRVFLDACIPDGTEVRVYAATADEPPEEAVLTRTLPANAGAGLAVLRPDLSPPMPPLSFMPEDVDGVSDFQPIHRRESGRELPWAQPHADDRFVTFEAPIQAPPGRYLWITLKLVGTTRLTPKVRAVRAEYPSHDYLRRLPRAFSRDEVVASFLRRYLAIFEGFLGEVDARGAERATLLDPRAAPDEVLPWLASFLGLVLDERWSPEKQRTLIAEIADLWRARGTVRGLTRLMEIYLGVAPIIIERFRMRGIGGAILGVDNAPIASSVLGAGFRIGGAVGTPDGAPLGPAEIDDSFRTHAHRFSVVIPMVLDDVQRIVIRDILEAHRPAHTLYDVCTVGAGIRVGLGLNVGLTSILGRSSGFETMQIGRSALGAGAILGRPALGTKPGVDRVGFPMRVG